MTLEGQGLSPGDQVASQGDDFEPDPVGPVAVERQVTQAGVLQTADTVFGAGALAVTHFQGRQRPAGSASVGRKAGDSPAVMVGQP